MPRKSAASTLIEIIDPEVIQRPDAPYELNDEEADCWRAIVNALPADHFMAGNFPLLVRLCKHIAASRRVDQLIDAETKKKEVDTRALRRLYLMASAESRMIQTLSRSMRLTQQSVYLPETAARRRLKGITATSTSVVKAPWHKDNDDESGD